MGLVVLAALAAVPLSAACDEKVVVASKIFTESYILGEIAAQSCEQSRGTEVDRKLGMGSTGILFAALQGGKIDVYPDYSGTLAETILKQPSLKSLDEINAALAPLGLVTSQSLGFSDTYALAVPEAIAQRYGLATISDLRRHSSELRAAFSYEFMDRADGYAGLVAAYELHLDPGNVRRMEHTLVYRALEDGAVDLIEVYSTDANIEKFHLHVLTDDRHYFPSYEAVWVARRAFVDAHPDLWTALRKYEHAIDRDRMVRMNAAVDIDRRSAAAVASAFIGSDVRAVDSRTDEILRRTREHLWLVAIASLFSILIGIPLGILASRYYVAGQSILLASALIQTIPSLALLCFLIPLFGIGIKPALVALCLYSLLPVVLNTFTGIRNVDPRHVENARAFGLSDTRILLRIVLPLASPTILAGVRTATIVGIGTATLAALIGAGGYGALIVSGLSLNDMSLILAGAIPAAVMALAAHLLFDLLGRIVIPRGIAKPRRA
jgi:osmoprotectant transport system permease protein